MRTAPKQRTVTVPQSILRSVGALALALLLVGCESNSFAPDSQRKGLQLYNQGNYTDAAGSFQNAVRQSPTDFKSHYYLGLSFEKLGQNQRAIAALKSARDTQFQTGEGVRDLGSRQLTLDALARNLAASADRDFEIRLLRERAAIARDSEDYVLLARMFRAAGDPDNALVTYEDASTRYPRDHALLKEYGFYLKSLNINARAKDVLTRASRLRIDREVSAALRDL
jgi:tetratricopeptide (TPR) repeat protein